MILNTRKKKIEKVENGRCATLGYTPYPAAPKGFLEIISMLFNRRARDRPSLPLHAKFNHRMAPQSLESAVQSHFSRPSKDAGVGIKFARCLFSRPAPSRHNQMLAQLLSGLHAPLRDPSTPCHICRSHTSDALFSMVETLAVS